MNLELEKQTTSRPLTDRQMADWTAYALSKFPHEACAYIVGDEIVGVENMSPEPLDTFKVSPYDRLFLESQGRIRGFLHTHRTKDGDENRHWPSSHDMRSWLADDIRWGISVCDGENVSRPVWMDEDHVAPLNGRVFIHGIHDCYAAVRDWFKVNRGVVLKNYPRHMEWWLQGEDLYMQQFKDAGFIEISEKEAGPGDCMMMSIHARGVVSHAAVITSNHTMYHHTYSRTGEGLSGEVEIGRWSKHAIKFVRYAGLS